LRKGSIDAARKRPCIVAKKSGRKAGVLHIIIRSKR